jgi:hypothetical protein
MAKVTVTRTGQPGLWRQPFRILIDGRAAASIAARETLELDLTPGRHRVAAELKIWGSQPVVIDSGPDDLHRLAVGTRLGGALSTFPFWPVLSLLVISSSPAPVGGGILLMVSLVLAPYVLMALFILWRHQTLHLEVVPVIAQARRPVAEVRQAGTPYLWFTVRELMGVVAILAVYVGAAIELTRFEQSSGFRGQAAFHARLEALYRKSGQDAMRDVARWQKIGVDTSPLRSQAAGAAAVADYHATMRRKYEEAAARRAFSVEPDPPVPPLP